MTTFLLDANVLIALTVAEHEHHETASRWAHGVANLAICPVVEGALVRFLVRIGAGATTAQQVLTQVYAREPCDFWPGTVSYRDIDLSRVLGHRQVTDAYLVGLVASRSDARLATLDRPLAAAAPDHTHLVGS